MQHNSAEYLHTLIEALRYVRGFYLGLVELSGLIDDIIVLHSLVCHTFANLKHADFVRSLSDTQYYVTDPEFEHVPVKELLSEVYISRLQCIGRFLIPFLRITSIHAPASLTRTEQAQELYTCAIIILWSVDTMF